MSLKLESSHVDDRSIGANISMLFRHRSWPERYRAAKAAGFTWVETWWPQGITHGEYGIDDVAEWVADAGVKVGMINAYEGKIPQELGLALDPARSEAFYDSLDSAVTLARRLDCPRVAVLAGRVPPGIDQTKVVARIIDRMREAADALGAAGLMLLVEPLNAVDVPDYAIVSTAAALELIDLVDRPNVRLLLDSYQAAVSGENVATAIRQAGSRLGSLQLADYPGRQEPLTGAIPWDEVGVALAAIGYDGPIALEYAPSHVDGPSFDYLPSLTRALFPPPNHYRQRA